MKTENLLSIAVIGIVLALILLSYGQSPEDEDIITVSGEGEITVDPDEATIILAVDTLADTADEAQENNAATMNKVIAAIEKLGLTKYETSNFNLYPRYDYTKDEQVLLGYEARHTLTLTVTEMDKIGEYADAAIKAGANRVNDIRFGLSKQKELISNAQALQRASIMANEKARAITDSLGVKLGDLEQISESNVYYAQPRFAMAESMDAGTTITPGDLDVTATVTLVYEIK